MANIMALVVVSRTEPDNLIALDDFWFVYAIKQMTDIRLYHLYVCCIVHEANIIH
jgi:hypothetical protein